MDKQSFLSSITEIGSLEDIVEVRTKLAELSNDVSSIFDQNTELTESNKKYEEDNEKLRSANNKLFLMIGDPEKEPEGKGNPESPKIEKSLVDIFNTK